MIQQIQQARRFVHRLFSAALLISLLASAMCHALDANLPPSGNFDLTHWYLTLPDDNATIIRSNVLSNGYTHPNWFYTGPEGEMVFWCPVDGGTTSGATYPRSELRETLDPGSFSVNWSVYGVHTLDAQCKVQQIPSNGRVVIGQIHSYLGNAYELIVLNYINGSIYAQVRVSPNGSAKTNQLMATVPLGEIIDYQIHLVDGLLSVTVNGFRWNANLLQLDPAWADNSFYFKAGSYVHDNDGNSDEGSLVAFSRLSATHGGPPSITRQPTDLTVRTNSTATFTADASGSSPLFFQWNRDGVALPGETNRSLQLVAVTTNDIAGYQCSASNEFGSATSRVARLSVSAAPLSPTLGNSVDYTGVQWSTAGNAPWLGQTAVTHDSADAAQSASIGHSQTSTLKTTVNGPGMLGFWWRVSSEPSNDRLIFYLAGSEKSRLSGESGWQWKSFSISSGSQELNWTYSKNSSKTGGLDRAWLDEVKFIPTSTLVAPVVIVAPASTNLESGNTATFSVAAFGSPTLKYQWRQNGTNLTNSSSTGISGATTATLTLSGVPLARVGEYTVVVTNAAGAVTSAPAMLAVTPVPTLAEALDLPGLTWTTSGSPAWSGQTNVTHDGTDAARSGAIGHDTSTSMQTKVTGPGTLTFFWKVSCQTNDDRLRFYLNGSEKARISGAVDWQPRTFVLSSGTQTLKWSYSKSKDLTAGEDRAWLDEVQFIPSASLLALAPTPAAESVVVNIMATVKGILLTWPVQPATQYRVFFKERWDEEWQELSADISISDGNASAVDQSTAPQRFYRIVAQ